MVSRILLALTLALSSTGITFLPAAVRAETPLSSATIQKLQKQVELSLKTQPVRSAKLRDVMTPGDALRTFRQAMAELRFNDSSIARVGEQAQFVFVPNTRNFQLNRGTVLLLIPPGQGRTRVNTPNAAAGIRGSALFVRYIEDSDVTMVGALTNSSIEITTKTGQTVVLKAGQIGYVYKDQIGVYNFDQKTFQETSPFFKDLDWTTISPAVKQEIDEALKEQGTFAGKFNETPIWIKLSDNRAPVTPPIAKAITPSNIDKPDADYYKGPNSVPGTPQPQSVPQPVYQPSASQPPTVPEPVSLPNRPEPVVTPSAPMDAVNSASPPITSTPLQPVNQVVTLPPRPVPAPVSPATQSATFSGVTAPPAAAVPPIAPAAPTPAAAALPPVTPPPAVPTPIAAPAPPAPAPITPPPAPVTPPAVVTVATPPPAPPAPPPVVTPPPVVSSPAVAAPATTNTANVPVAPAASPPPTIQLPPAAPAPAPAAPSAATAPTSTAGSGGVQTPAASPVGGTRPLPIVTP